MASTTRLQRDFRLIFGASFGFERNKTLKLAESRHYGLRKTIGLDYSNGEFAQIGRDARLFCLQCAGLQQHLPLRYVLETIGV